MKKAQFVSALNRAVLSVKFNRLVVEFQDVHGCITRTIATTIHATPLEADLSKTKVTAGFVKHSDDVWFISRTPPLKKPVNPIKIEGISKIMNEAWEVRDAQLTDELFCGDVNDAALLTKIAEWNPTVALAKSHDAMMEHVKRFVISDLLRVEYENQLTPYRVNFELKLHDTPQLVMPHSTVALY